MKALDPLCTAHTVTAMFAASTGPADRMSADQFVECLLSRYRLLTVHCDVAVSQAAQMAGDTRQAEAAVRDAHPCRLYTRDHFAAVASSAAPGRSHDDVAPAAVVVPTAVSASPTQKPRAPGSALSRLAARPEPIAEEGDGDRDGNGNGDGHGDANDAS